MKKKFLLLLIIISFKTYADCTPKDLTDPNYLKSVGKENLIKHFQTPRNQDGVGWCGSYSASDSLSFAVSEPVSALDISINYFANQDRNRNNVQLDELNGIFPQGAPEMAKEYGYCPESVIPSNQTSSSNLGQRAIFKLMETFQQIHDEYVNMGRPTDFCVDCIESYEKVIKPSIPSATSDLIKNILLKNQSDSLTAFRDMLDKLCEGRRVKIQTQIQIITKNSLRNKTVASVVDNALDNNSMPSFGMNTSYFTNAAAVPGGHGPHEMMIVARRMSSNGKCEYLVRNSWGKGCSYYLPHIVEKCDEAKGSFWMDQGQLQAGVTDLLIIKDEKRQIPLDTSSILNTQNAVSNANTQTTPILTNTQTTPILTNTQNAVSNANTQNAVSNANTQNAVSNTNTQNAVSNTNTQTTPILTNTQTTPILTNTQNTPAVEDTQISVNAADIQNTDNSSNTLISTVIIKPIEQNDQIEKADDDKIKKKSIFNFFKRKSKNDNTIKDNANVNTDNIDSVKTNKVKGNIANKFSNFFSSIWKSLSKAFKY